MWPISIKLKDMEIANIQLGYVGENDVTPVIIDCESVFSEYPNAVPTMTVQPPKGLKYPAEIERDGNNVIWTVQNYDLNYDGEGEIQIKFTENGKIKKSASCKTTIKKSIEPEAEAPTPIEDWMERAEDVLESLDGLTVSAETLDTGEDATAEVSEDEQGHKHIDFGLPRGPQGPGPSSEEITEAVDDYLESNFTNPSNPPLDRSLLSSLSAAPADMVGNLKSAVTIIPDGIKAAAGFQMATFFSGYESTVAEGETSSHVENANYISAKIPATSTDYVEFCGEGGSGNQRLYAVLDAENKVLFRSHINISGKKTPTMSNYPTAAYVIVNVKKSYTGATYLFVGQTIDEKIEEEITPVLVGVQNEIDEVEKSVSVGGTWDVDLSDFGIVYATISSTKKWNVGVGYQSYAVNVQPYSFATVTIKAKADATCVLGFMTSKEIGADQSTVTTFANGENRRRTIDADGTGTFTIPSNCTYILIGKKSSGNDITPVSVSISGSRNTVVEVEKKLREIDFSSVEQNPLRAINSTSSGRDIPQSIAIRNAYKKAHQLLDLPWVALLPYPKTETPNTYAQPGNKVAVPYSSVKEYNKFVGFNVSLRTFMTAVHNPYSLMYTEDVLESHQQSAYGIEYHGSNCGPYFGNVCSSFDLFALGMDIPWTTDQFDYLERIGKLHRLTDQSANGVRLMDIIWEPGHTTLVTDILRDERGTPTQITVSEYGPKTTNYTPEQFNERLRTKPGIIYMYMDLYKNLSYTPSEFVAVDGESTPAEYTYNDDICTFAGDYACFNSGEDIYINYTAGNYTQMQVFKGETLIETISLVAADHAVKITPDGYGKYKARLTNGTQNSDYTYFEIVDTTLTASYFNGNLTINFSSENGIPVYAEIVNRAGFTRGFIELDEKAISEGTITVNPQMILAEQLPETSLPSTFYPRVLFKGDYGMVANPFYAVQS